MPCVGASAELDQLMPWPNIPHSNYPRAVQCRIDLRVDPTVCACAWEAVFANTIAGPLALLELNESCYACCSISPPFGFRAGVRWQAIQELL